MSRRRSSTSRAAWLARRRSRRAADTPGPEVEFAWRVHAAQESWASKADVKASILLAFEGGVLYAIVSALGHGGILASPGGLRHVVEAAGILLLLLSLVAAAAAVFPRLGPVKDHRKNQRHVIYFGDLRRWDDAELRHHLATLNRDAQLEALSLQLVQMARYNWSKYRWVQASLILSLTGILIVAAAAVTAH